MVDRIVPATTGRRHRRERCRAWLARCGAGHARAVPAMGDRGRLCRRPPGMGSGRCADGRRCRAVRSDEAAAAQRQPFGSGLPRLPRRLRIHLPSRGADGLCLAHAAADARRSCAHAASRRPAIDLAAYQNVLLERFSNPALPHRTQQIAMDGSQKLPQRLLATVRDNLAAGRSIDLLALAVAGWMRYASGVDEAGREITCQRPDGRRVRAHCRRAARQSAGAGA